VDIDKMLSWEEWEKLVIDSQRGNDISLRILLEESRSIIENVSKAKLKTEDDVDFDDIRQEVYLRVIKNLGFLRDPRYYALWLKRITENYCKDIKRKSKNRKFKKIDELNLPNEDKTVGNFNNIADRRGLETDAFTLFKERFNQITGKEFQIRAKKKSDEITNTIGSLSIRKGQTAASAAKISVLSSILGKSLVAKEEYNFLQAEKKLRAIINFTEKIRLNKELRYIQAKAITEFGHLKMNQGFVTGIDGSIYWYERAGKIWRSLKDRPMELFVRQQIGVSHHIQGDDKKATMTYDDILTEIGRKRKYRALKADVWRDQSNAFLAIDAIGKSFKDAEKSLLIAEDVGGYTLSYTQLQMAKIYIKKGKYNQAYSLIMQCIDNTPRYRVLDHIKYNIALFDLFIKTNEKDAAFKLIPKIQTDSSDHRFYHQLQKLQDRLSIM
jgi:DNA-directed RNA polymerase specialized sigma24 family protein